MNIDLLKYFAIFTYFLAIVMIIFQPLNDLFNKNIDMIRQISPEFLISLFISSLSYSILLLPFKIPYFKVISVLPKMKKRQIYLAIQSYFLNLTKGHIYLLFIILLTINFNLINGFGFYNIFLFSIQFLALFIVVYIVRISFKYFLVQEKLISGAIFLVFNSLCFFMPGILLWIMYLFIIVAWAFYLLNVFLDSKYEIVLNEFKQLNNKLLSYNKLPIFFQKELRMIFRTKRLNKVFIFMLIYTLIFGLVIYFSDKRGDKIFLQIMLIGTTLNYSEYFNFFWSWDKNKTGLILSLPSFKDLYIKEKKMFSSLILLPALLMSSLIFSLVDSIFFSINIVLVFVYIINLYSLNLKDTVSFLLEKNIFFKPKLTLYFGFVLISILSYNFYFIILPENMFIKLGQLALIIILCIFAKKITINYWKNYEWNR
jgi:hypothetical protein